MLTKVPALFASLAIVSFVAIAGFFQPGSPVNTSDSDSTSIGAAGQPSPEPQHGPTPTPDRLAPPPTVTSPTQADDGAQLFWLYCQPCHGDQGQGLTDEWRDQYPPEHRNCWMSGCHGKRPYENGFILPTRVPPLIGGDSLARFGSLGQLHAYIGAAMPFENPGGLTDDEYLAITAFLGRAHGAWNSAQPLDAASLNGLPLRPTPVDGAAIIMGSAGLILAAAGVWLIRRRNVQ